MLYYILAGICLITAAFLIMLVVLKIPRVSCNSRLRLCRTAYNAEEKDTFTFLSFFYLKLMKHLSVPIALKTKIEILLQQSEVAYTPELLIAKIIVIGIFFIALSLPFFLFGSVVSAIIGVLIIVIGIKKAGSEYSAIKHRAIYKQKYIEREIPEFVEFFAYSVKESQNIEQIFLTYVQNYNTFLSVELQKTIADMRTGSQEKALSRFESRINNQFISSLTRGILATVRGEDMTVFFDDLTIKAENLRKQRMMESAHIVDEKVSSYSRKIFFASITYLIIIMVAIILPMTESIF